MCAFLALSRQKPGFPLQSFLPLCGKKGFPLQSLARPKGMGEQQPEGLRPAPCAPRANFSLNLLTVAGFLLGLIKDYDDT
jgi:hypothetical protein